MNPRLRRVTLVSYALLLAASHGWMLTHPPSPPGPSAAPAPVAGPVPSGPGPHRVSVEIPAMDDGGPSASGARTSLSILRFGPAADPRPPVLCLHGSPGSARNFEDLGQSLAGADRRVLAVDLPGFGRTTGVVPSYSILAHARAALAALDALDQNAGRAPARVHLVTWSMGGGVALHMAELAPERVASISLIASIGVQEAEGSGSYGFEHAKYAALGLALGVFPELLPHFGALGHYGRGWAFVRNFWDTDQRPLTDIMRRLETPTLILHGRDDFLVPVWAAERSHELIGPSRLELSDAGHFLPLGGEHGQLAWTLERLAPFLARHDAPGVAEPRLRVDGTTPRAGLERVGLEPFTLTRVLPWWVHLLALVVAAAWAPRTAACVAGALVAGLQLDFGLALLACLAGAALHTGRAPARAGPVAEAAGDQGGSRGGSRGGSWLAGLPAALGWTLLTFLVSLAAGGLVAAWGGLPAVQWLACVPVVLAWFRARARRALPVS